MPSCENDVLHYAERDNAEKPEKGSSVSAIRYGSVETVDPYVNCRQSYCMKHNKCNA